MQKLEPSSKVLLFSEMDSISLQQAKEIIIDMYSELLLMSQENASNYNKFVEKFENVSAGASTIVNVWENSFYNYELVRSKLRTRVKKQVNKNILAKEIELLSTNKF